MTKEPTPIRKRASSPEPIILPKQPTLDERIDSAIKKALYALMRSEEEVNIVSMTYQEFEAFWKRVMEEEA